MAEKTEEPTPRRLKKARDDGDAPVSSALVRAVGVAVVVVLAPSAVAASAAKCASMMRDTLTAHGSTPDVGGVVFDVLTLTVPWLVVAAIAAGVTATIQTGGVVRFAKIAPDLSRVDPFAGLRRLITREKLFGLGRALVAAGAIAWLTADAVLEEASSVVATVGSVPSVATVAGVLARRIAWWAAVIGLALAAVDVAVTQWAWHRRHRMTKDEVRREHKEAEGDPELRAARQRAHRELADGATIASVRDATVVVVNPTHLATALRYTGAEDEAPRIVASGEGDLARRMIAAAHAFGVPVVQDVPVARALRELQVGDEIPEALYEAVAEILREVWEADGDARS